MCSDIQIKGAKRFLSAIRRGTFFCFLIETNFSDIFKVWGKVADFGIFGAVT